MKKQFGACATQAHLAKYARSPHSDGKKFVNLEETFMKFSFQHLPKLL